MKRILVALFTIGALVSGGLFATSAYFSDTASQTNYTFTTGTADLKFALCGDGETLNVDCSSTAATLDSLAFSSSSQTGPGVTGEGCLVIENTGDYNLHLTSKLVVTSQSAAGMWDAFEVEAETSDSACTPGSGSVLFSWQSAHSAQSQGDVAIGSLAPGQRMYVIQRNRWNSTGDQNALQNQSIQMDTSVTGKTD